MKTESSTTESSGPSRPEFPGGGHLRGLVRLRIFCHPRRLCRLALTTVRFSCARAITVTFGSHRYSIISYKSRKPLLVTCVTRGILASEDRKFVDRKFRAKSFLARRKVPGLLRPRISKVLTFLETCRSQAHLRPRFLACHEADCCQAKLQTCRNCQCRLPSIVSREEF